MNDLTLFKENFVKKIPPYILVGHSRGGLNMQLFAQKYPDDTIGVVLVDSVSRDQNFHDPFPPKSNRSYRETITFDESRRQVKNSEPFPAIPIIVLTATNHHESNQFETLWQTWQSGIARLSSKSIQIYAWNCGHYIQKQQPALVVNAIYTIIYSSN
jgi:pimeloyl-ACP methyl ester carboxylesterase